MLQDIFSHPSSAFRGKPFWAWNGKLREEELRRQIRIFKKMGLGGGFMHSRVGLATEYLSDEWFKMVEACIDEARKTGLEAWLYDEDRWPSGAAGGIVTKDHRFRQKRLVLTISDPRSAALDGRELAVFLARVDRDTATEVRRVEPQQLERAGERESVLIFRVREAEESPWYNGQTYLDTLSADAVRRFIEVTHEAYAERVGEYFGSIVPGIFTDEPNYGGFSFGDGGGEAPWTDDLPSVFRDRYGYDILDHLPEIFFRVDGRAFSKARLNYRDCITHLFVRSFAEQIGRWCEEHELLFTGHVLAEETLTSQTSVIGSAMRFYEFMQAPGIDILRGEILQREGGVKPELATAKQCSSVKHQLGRRWMLSELYGCTGWHFTLAEHKAVGDWQAALGVNLRCQHLSLYTMEGQAKRDYPASISFQSPWWRDYPVVEDYFARVGVLLTVGEPVRDVAVIHPIESAWGLYCGRVGEIEELRQLEISFEKLQSILLRNHVDFDYVDEEMASRLASVDGGLVVGRARYRAVIVPPMATMRSTTLALLDQLINSGVPVIFVGKVAPLVDGERSDAVLSLAGRAESCDLAEQLLVNELSKVKSLRRVSIRTADGSEYGDSLYMLRHDESSGLHVLFVCHTRQDRSSGPLEVKVPAKGQVQEWDASTGEIFLAEYEETKDGVVIRTELPPYGSRLFVVDQQPKEGLERRPSWSEIRRTEVSQEDWPILRDEPNAFPLDVAEFSIGGGEWQGPLEILKVDDAIRRAMGLPERGGRMVQPWAREKRERPVTQVRLVFRFDVEKLPSGPCHLVMERPDRFRIRINGNELDPDEDEGWWIDTSFKRLRVPAAYLRTGENRVELEIEYGPEDGLESLYFCGEFGVKWRRRRPVVTDLPNSLKLGDWTEQGFPCYSGSITYRATFAEDIGEGERLFVEVPSWEGTLIKIRVNGSPATPLAWPPYEADVTEYLQPGENHLEVEVVSSRRNLLGPLHYTVKYPDWTGPDRFKTTGELWTDDYVKVPYGLMAPPVLSVRMKK